MIIRVKVRPDSLEDSIKELSEGEYEICIKEKAEEGKANKKVIKLLSSYFNVSWRNIKIKNPSSRSKIIEIKL